MTANEHVNAPGFVDPVGYSDATRSGDGRRLVFLAGHVAFDKERRIVHAGDLVAQVRQTLHNLRGTLEAAGGHPEDLVKLTIHTMDVPAWRAQLGPIGAAWRDVLGRVFPATTLLGIAELFDDGALVEIDGIAAVPIDAPSG
ncbi:MAG: enamine deaminase RidA [Planctomycetes bacterium]|nr:enamine deaminase RidA [Planctomycetota bacterium]